MSCQTSIAPLQSASSPQRTTRTALRVSCGEDRDRHGAGEARLARRRAPLEVRPVERLEHDRSPFAPRPCPADLLPLAKLSAIGGFGEGRSVPVVAPGVNEPALLRHPDFRHPDEGVGCGVRVRVHVGSRSLGPPDGVRRRHIGARFGAERHVALAARSESRRVRRVRRVRVTPRHATLAFGFHLSGSTARFEVDHVARAGGAGSASRSTFESRRCLARIPAAVVDSGRTCSGSWIRVRTAGDPIGEAATARDAPEA